MEVKASISLYCAFAIKCDYEINATFWDQGRMHYYALLFILSVSTLVDFGVWWNIS